MWINCKRSGGRRLIRQQGRRFFPADGRGTRLDQELQHVSMLRSKRSDGGQDPFHKAASPCTVGSEATLAPEDRLPDGPFGRVIPRSGLCRVVSGSHQRASRDSFVVEGCGIILFVSPDWQWCQPAEKERQHVL